MNGNHKKNTSLLLKSIICVFSVVSVVVLLCTLVFAQKTDPSADVNQEYPIMDRFDNFISDVLTKAQKAALSVPKRYWINDGDAPPPRDASKYGTAASAAELGWLLDEAAVLLDGQELIFNTDIEIREGTEITYYLDESIFAVCWQQLLDRAVYTYAEVKISDPSQFLRHLAGDEYASRARYTTTEQSAQVGAVIACSGDHYMGRPNGIMVYDGLVTRYTGTSMVDNCFVDTKGDLILVQKNTFESQEHVEAFIKEKGIRFSFAFGPVMIQDGKRVENPSYFYGEIFEKYPRSAICQKDKLHYLLVNVNGCLNCYNYPTISQLTDVLEKFDLQQAYTLDGGQSGAIAMEDKLMNPTNYPTGQRPICDIFYFTTAVPEKNK